MNAKLLASIDKAVRRGVPLVGLSSPDQPAIVNALVTSKVAASIVGWDAARGLYGLTPQGEAALTVVPMTGEKARSAAVAMISIASLPKDTVVLAQNLGRHLADAVTVQAVVNLRDSFKSNGRVLFIMDPDVKLPPELRHDVVLLEDPLPDDEGYRAVVAQTFKNAEEKAPENLDDQVAALRGLSSFEAEQVAAMELDVDGIASSRLWQHTAKVISKVKGLTMSLDGPPLEDVKGMSMLIQTYQFLFRGPMRPRLVLLLDEVEKSLGGLGSKGGPGDNTGVTQDALMILLVVLEELGWGARSCILLGLPGCGKTVFAKSLGKAYGAPMIRADLGAMTGSLKGESQGMIRDAMRAISSVGGEHVAVIATCNKLEVLPAEFKRRFRLQTWYADLPGREEKDQLWRVYLPKYGFTVKDQPKEDDGFTGANIRDACEMAFSLGVKPDNAAQLIIPVAKSDPDVVESLRTFASNRFLDVSKPGRYQKPGPLTVAGGRKVSI